LFRLLSLNPVLFYPSYRESMVASSAPRRINAHGWQKEPRRQIGSPGPTDSHQSWLAVGRRNCWPVSRFAPESEGAMVRPAGAFPSNTRGGTYCPHVSRVGPEDVSQIEHNRETKPRQHEASGPLLVLFALQWHTVSLHPFPHGCTADIETAGGFSLVPVALFEELLELLRGSDNAVSDHTSRC